MKFAEEPEEQIVDIKVYEDEYVDVDYLADKFNGFEPTSIDIQDDGQD